MAKAAVKSKKTAGKKKVATKAGKKGKGAKPSFKLYFSRLLKATHKGLALTSDAVKVLDSFVYDQLDRIATEAADVARKNKKETIGPAELDTAVRLVLPAELAKHAVGEGAKAVAKSS